MSTHKIRARGGYGQVEFGILPMVLPLVGREGTPYIVCHAHGSTTAQDFR